jgi:hypothetical protein
VLTIAHFIEKTLVRCSCGIFGQTSIKTTTHPDGKGNGGKGKCSSCRANIFQPLTHSFLSTIARLWRPSPIVVMSDEATTMPLV